MPLLAEVLTGNLSKATVDGLLTDGKCIKFCPTSAPFGHVLTASAGQVFENNILSGGTVTNDMLAATTVEIKTVSQSKTRFTFCITSMPAARRWHCLIASRMLQV
ncbi:MAG: hypothetical protein ACI9ZF_000048 [Bradyrhizobium sp.]|jgi:hypothetical protein